MVNILVMAESVDAATKQSNAVCEALVGVNAFINNQIIVTDAKPVDESDNPKGCFSIILGIDKMEPEVELMAGSEEYVKGITGTNNK